MVDGGRVAVSAVLATGTVVALIIMVVDGTAIGERTLPIIGLLLSVVLLLLLPDLMNYIRSRKKEE